MAESKGLKFAHRLEHGWTQCTVKKRFWWGVRKARGTSLKNGVSPIALTREIPRVKFAKNAKTNHTFVHSRANFSATMGPIGTRQTHREAMGLDQECFLVIGT